MKNNPENKFISYAVDTSLYVKVASPCNCINYTDFCNKYLLIFNDGFQHK